MQDLLNDPPAAPPPGTTPPASPPATPPATPPGTPPAEPPATPPGDKPPAADLAPDPNKAFMETLPQDLRNNPSLGRYSSTEALARAYLNAERMLGYEKVPVPKDANDQQAWDLYYKAGGRPDEPTAYEFVKPEKLPEGVQWDTDMEGWWKQAAFEAGLSQRQAGKLVDQYRDRFIAQIDLNNKNIDRQLTSAKTELMRDWGGEYEARRALAKAAFNEMPEDARNAAIANGLARMPSFVKYLYDVKAKVTGELAPRTPGQTGTTPEQLRDKIAQFRAQHTAALMDVHHPEHDLRVAEFTEMHNRLFSTEAAA